MRRRTTRVASIFVLADRIVALRRGEVAEERWTHKTNGDEIVHLMVGDTYVSPE